MVMANLTIEHLAERRRWVHEAAKGVVDSDPDACHDTRMVAGVFISHRIRLGKFTRPCVINARDADIRASQSTAHDKRVVESELRPTDGAYQDGIELGRQALMVACMHAVTDQRLSDRPGVPTMPSVPHAVPGLTIEALAS